MNALNQAITRCFDLVFAPMAGRPALALVVLSAVAGLIMLVIFRYTSRQRALRAAADRTKAALLALRLFRDDLGVALRGQVELLHGVAARLWHSLPPVLVLAVPFFFFLCQLALRYEHRPLRPGEAVVVEMAVRPDAWPTWREAALESPAGVDVETPALRDEEAHSLSWRVRAVDPGAVALVARAGDAHVEKRLVVAAETADVARLDVVNPRRPGSVWEALLFPGEPALGARSPVRRIDVRYPRRETAVFGVRAPWWLAFLVLSMVTALLLRRALRVEL